MAWNEPGNNNNDPWGSNRKKGNNNDGPPDLDDILKNTFGKLFGGGGSGNSGQGGDHKAPSSFIIVLILAALVGFYVFQGVGIVNEQERAVVLRFGKYYETKTPGFRWNPPFVDSVFTENVTRVRTWETKEQMLTKDLNIVDIKLSVQYAIDDAKDFVLNVKNPEESLQQASNSALRHVVGSTPMHGVLTEGRSQVAIEVQERLQSYLTDYTTGIRIEKVNIEDTNPPQEVQSAFDDVIRAREDEERYKNEAQAYVNDVIPAARGRAQRALEEASAYKEEVIAKAKGEADRFSLLLAEYDKAPEVTRNRLYIDAIQSVMEQSSKVVVDVEGGNNMMFLPLDKIVEAGARAAANSPRRSGNSSGVVDMDELASRVADKLRTTNSTSTRRREGR